MIDFSKIKELTVDGVKLKTFAINGVQIWKSGYTNQVPISIDTDKSVYNGKGYIDGYRLSSSGSNKAQTGSVATGFIPYKQGDIARMSGVEWSTTVSGGYVYIVFYDKNFSYVSHINRYEKGSSGDNGISNAAATVNKTSSSIITGANGVTTFNITFTKTLDIAYIRISATGSGANMVVTVNEEITSGAGKNVLESAVVTLNARYNSSNNLVMTDTAGYIAVDYYAVKNGDVIRFKPSTLAEDSPKGYQRLRCYNSSGTLVSMPDIRLNAEYPLTITNGVAKLTIPTSGNTNASYSNIAKMRMNLYVGAKTLTEADLKGLVVTVNEEIE